MKRNKNYIYFIIAGGLLLIVAALMLLLRPDADPQLDAARTTDSPVEETSPDALRVSLQDSKDAFDSGSAVFLDVRDADSFAQARIPGAINIPEDELSARMNELDSDQWIITYCT